jgi:DNA invertase Pin-like site-specific DNA recombinase
LRSVLPEGETQTVNAAIYARISTNEDRQHTQNQLDQLRIYAGKMRWKVTAEYREAESGARADRPQLKALMLAAAQRKFDVLLVSDLSRLTRQGPAATFELIAVLKSYGVQFWSMNEPHFRTADPAGTPSPAGDLFLAIAAYIAQQERENIRHRIKAGMATARKNGKAIGRPARLIDRARVLDLRAAGKSIREIAKLTKNPKSSIEKTIKIAAK